MLRVRVVIGVLCEIGAAVAWFGYQNLILAIILCVVGLVFFFGPEVLEALDT
jgi:hypothetical protein